MILYIDTSALIKRYVQETGSTGVVALVEQADLVGSTIMARVEMAAALAKAARMQWVTVTGAQSAWQDFDKHWPSFARLAVTNPLVERASQITWEHHLRGYDAIHLATALIWQESMQMPVSLATYDRELWVAANATGLSAWPENLVN